MIIDQKILFIMTGLSVSSTKPVMYNVMCMVRSQMFDRMYIGSIAAWNTPSFTFQ